MILQSIFEIIFDLSYLIIVLTIGTLILSRAHNITFKIFGTMALVLVIGDAFHLVPRIYALSTNGIENHLAILGTGKFITSISMTIFYVLLYHFSIRWYELSNKLTVWVYLLAIIRLVLCLFPQNEWQMVNPSFEWAIYRNIPFLVLGLLMIILLYNNAHKTIDKSFKYMWVAISLSFGFYLPVVLFADNFPIVGLLMIPKTVAYIWMIAMGWMALKREPLSQSNF